MARLLTYMRPYKHTVGISLVLLGVGSLLQVAGPLLTKLAIDRYLLPNGGTGSSPLDPYLSAEPRTGLTQISVLYLLALVGNFFMEFGQTYLMQWTGQNAMSDLRRQVMAHLQK